MGSTLINLISLYEKHINTIFRSYLIACIEKMIYITPKHILQCILPMAEISSFISYLLNSFDISIIEASASLIDILIIKLESKILSLFIRSGILFYLRSIDKLNLVFPPK